MTQSSRTTETMNRDHAAIREVMHRARELTVPDRATLAVGLIGHLATLMNRSQMAKLLDQLREEAERVQDVPPSRQRDLEAAVADAAPRRGSREDETRPRGPEPGPGEAVREAEGGANVGQSGRGEFRADTLM